MIIPPAEAGGFSGQLCGNPLAYVLKTDIPARAEDPLMHDPGGRDVPVERAAAGAAVQSVAERLGPDRAAGGAGLRGAARIDQLHLSTGACNLVHRELDE